MRLEQKYFAAELVHGELVVLATRVSQGRRLSFQGNMRVKQERDGAIGITPRCQLGCSGDGDSDVMVVVTVIVMVAVMVTVMMMM